MSSSHLESVARALVAEGKGILAADETVPTLTQRFQPLGMQADRPAGQSQRSGECWEVRDRDGGRIAQRG